jgi:FkbM family methyltransferase
VNYSKIREFYNQLEDTESQYIFEKRIQYLFTGDVKHIYDMTEETNRLFHPIKTIRNIRYLFENSENFPQNIIIYGTGEMSSKCLKMLKENNIKVLAFCDKKYENYANSSHVGFPVISPKELKSDPKYNKCAIVISSTVFYKEISNELILNGFSSSCIFIMESQFKFSNYPYRPSYFEQDFIKSVDNEVYVDAGCYDGFTIKQFTEFCSGNYSKIFGFEPHPIQYEKTINNIKNWGINNTTVHQKGVWSTDGEYSFTLEYGTGAAGARIIENGNTRVQTTTIDKTVGSEYVTFIKMDVEGAELEALKGAREIILRCKPKLAICVYHKLEDIVEIPEFIYSLIPDYKFYLRHHNNIRPSVDVCLDTILYAV